MVEWAAGGLFVALLTWIIWRVVRYYARVQSAFHDLQQRVKADRAEIGKMSSDAVDDELNERLSRRPGDSRGP